MEIGGLDLKKFDPGRLTHNLKRLVRKENPDEAARKVATEAFLLLSAAGPDGQKPQAEYHRDFDFTQYRVGSVFRLEYGNNRGKKGYIWYALGGVDAGKKQVEVFTVYQGLNHFARRDNGKYLTLDPDYRIIKAPIKKPYFQLPEALNALELVRDSPIIALLKRELETPHDEIFHPIKMELIKGGIPEKVKERANQPKELQILQPSPQKIGL